MGQMTSAVMLAVDLGTELCGEDSYENFERWIRVDRSASHRLPRIFWGETDQKQLLGYWVAVGASGDGDLPDLDTSFPLDGFGDVETYTKALTEARADWEAFAEWARARGREFGSPRLWLVQREVG